MNILTQKLGFKKASLSRVYAPKMHPAGDWSSKVELKSSLSGDLKSSFEIQVFTLTWLKLGFKKSSLSQVFSPRFHPGIQKWS